MGWKEREALGGVEVDAADPDADADADADAPPDADSDAEVKVGEATRVGGVDHSGMALEGVVARRRSAMGSGRPLPAR